MNILELAHHLRQEHLFIMSERDQIQKLNSKVIQTSERLFHLGWIIRQQRANLDRLFLSQSDANPASCCFLASALENVSFIDSYRKLGAGDSNYSSILTLIRKSPKLLALCLVNLKTPAQLPLIVQIILSSIYAECLVSEDRLLVSMLLKELIKLEISSNDNPRRMLRHGSSAFSRIYKIFSEGLSSTKLFLISALHGPVVSVLADDDLYLDTDVERAILRFPPEERLRHFGIEGSKDYLNNIEKYKIASTEKLSTLVLKFVDYIRNNIYCFPDILYRLIQQLSTSLREANQISEREIVAICSDLVFGHFICHAIINPEQNGIVDMHISSIARFNLMQIAQVIQNLAVAKWEDIDPKVSNLYDKFPKDCLSSQLEMFLLNKSSEYNSDIKSNLQDISRKCVLITESHLDMLTDFLLSASVKWIEEEGEEKKELKSLLAGIQTKPEPVNANLEVIPEARKKGLLERVSRRSKNTEPILSESTVNQEGQINTQNFDPEVLVIPLNVNFDQSLLGMLPEEKILEPKVPKLNSFIHEQTESLIKLSIGEKTDCDNNLPQQDLLGYLNDEIPSSSMTDQNDTNIPNYSKKDCPLYENKDVSVFISTKRKLRKVLSLVDLQTLPLLEKRNGNDPAETDMSAKLKNNGEIIKFLKILYSEARHLQNSTHLVALQEAIRCVEVYDDTVCQQLFRSLGEDYQQRSPYITYLVKSRQNLLTIVTHFDRLLSYLSQEKSICTHNLIALCVRHFLEKKEKVIGYFVSSFQKLNVADEKVQLVELFLVFLYKSMEVEPVWQMSNEEQLEYARGVIERSIMGQIYINALYPNGDGDISRDQILYQHMQQLSNIITPNHKDLRIPEMYHSESPWLSAQEEIITLNAYKTPREKIQCVVRTCTIIMNLLSLASDRSVPAADDLMPVLVFVLIKANPNTLLSTVQYVNSFFEKHFEGEEAYWWIQFSSAVEFIKTMDY